MKELKIYYNNGNIMNIDLNEKLYEEIIKNKEEIIKNISENNLIIIEDDENIIFTKTLNMVGMSITEKKYQEKDEMNSDGYVIERRNNE